MNDIADYRAFLEAKACVAQSTGFTIADADIHPLLKPHQRAIVRWAVEGGRRAIFAAFGLGKSVMQLEVVRLTLAQAGGRGLIVAPLGVRQEFVRDAAMLGIPIRFIRRIEEADETGLYITNYETIRDGKLDPGHFTVVSLDEAACLRGFGGTKTFREFMRLFDADGGGGRVRYRFVATATPSPNEYIELLAYAAFLGILDVGHGKTRFFKRNSEKADKLTIHPHKEREFWLWLNSWAIFLQRPSDLGFSDDGYSLPPIQVHYHEVKANIAGVTVERDGQGVLMRDAAIGVQDAAREKRETLPARIDAMNAILAAHPDERAILWHDLEAERHAIQAAVPDAVPVYGSQDLEDREAAIIGFSEGRFQYLSAKPSVAGSGCNFQRHCSRAIFLGIGFKFADFIQAIHRVQRFLQPSPVHIHIIYAESEREILRTLKRKWAQHEELTMAMSDVIREHGLNALSMADALKRSIGVERIEAKGETYRLINADCVEEARRMESNSVDLIVTSIPFSTQYEYTPSYNDFGHTDDNAHFWRQMDYLTPELLRVLKPGRVAAIHVKDRIVPGGINGFGFQSVEPFSDETTAHFRRHGFAFLARKTIGTDVVRENNQTYRLGWTEQCKDGSRMGCGMPEYLILLRKPPTDRTNGYADDPVVKLKKVAHRDHWENPTGYSRARWQLDAHGVSRSNGNRLLAPEEFVGLPADKVYKLWKRFNLESLYDFEHHVLIGESLEMRGALPPTFMLLPPHIEHPDIWTDVARMLTLNKEQSVKGREMHLCPLQYDVADRAIAQFSMPGELVFDPFAGIGTVPMRALKAGRRGLGTELNPGYFLDAVKYCEAQEREMAVPSLFDALDLAPAPVMEAAE